MKNKKHGKVIALAIVLALIFIVFKPSILSVTGGFGTLSISKIEFNDNTNKWIINAIHSGIGDSYLIVPSSEFAKLAGVSTTSELKLRESGYETWCKYTQGNYVKDSYEIIGPIYGYGQLLEWEWRSAFEKDHPEAVEYWCSEPYVVNFFSTQRTCYEKALAGKYYAVDYKGPQFKSTLTLEYEGKTASIDLSNDNLNGNLVVNGKSVGYVNVVGGLTSLKDACDSIPYYWFESSRTGERKFVEQGSNNDRALSAFEACANNLKSLGILNAYNLKQCWDSYESAPKDTVVSLNGVFIEDTKGSYFKVIPDSNVVNVEYSITVDADYIKVNRPAGVPKIISAGFVSDSYKSGDKAVVKYVIKNDNPDSDYVSFDLVLSCDGGFTKALSSTPNVKGGETVTGYISTRASCVSQEFDNAKCVLKAQGFVPVNGVIPTDEYELSGTCTPSSGQCVPNALYCSEDGKSIVQCDSDGYGLEVVQECSTKCVMIDGSAKCEGENVSIIQKGVDEGGEGGQFKMIHLFLAVFALVAVLIFFSGVKNKRRKSI